MAQAQTSTRLVGRDEEMAALAAGLSDAASGAGRLFLVAGEPGIGKSRLADEIAARARDAEFSVLWGRGWEDAGAPAYWPWVQIFRAIIRTTDAEIIRGQLATGAADVGQMLPELHDLFPDLELPAAATSDSARFRLFDAATAFLRRNSDQRPIVAVLDDLQAADEPSVLLLRFLASQLGDMRMLVVGTYRDVALRPDEQFSRAIDEMARERATRLIRLRGLDTQALNDFIAAVAGVEPVPSAVAAIERETKGNPLFVTEAVRLLSAEGGLNNAVGLPALRVRVPAGIRDVIGQRIAGLGERVVQVLELAALIGPEFAQDSLRMLGADTTGLAETLDVAESAGLVSSISGGTGRYRFSHDLVREALYQGLAPSQRERLHARIAVALEEQHASDPGPHLTELAFHAYEAAGSDPVMAGKAVDYAIRAGERSSRALAYEEAARQFRMALQLLDAKDEAKDELRTEVLLKLGDVRARAGDLGARETFLQAAEIARRTGAATQLARAALGIGGRLPWARPGANHHLIPALQDALVQLGGADDRLRVRLLTRLACAWRSSPEQREQSAALSRQAVDLARSLGDPATLSYALAGRYWATWWPENPEQRLPMAEEMVSVAEQVGDAERLVDAHLMLFISYADLGRMTDARAKLQDVITRARDVPGLTPAQLWLGVAPVAQIALMDGEYQRAAELLSREQEYGFPLTPARDDVSAWRMHRFLLARELGTVGDLEAEVRASVDEFPWYPVHRAALSLLLLDVQREAEARDVFDDLAQGEFRALYRDSEWLLGTGMAAEACARLGDEERAAVLHAQLTPFAGRHAIGHAEGSIGAMDRYLGLLSATLGHMDEAIAFLESAADLNQQMGARPWLAHTLADLASTLRRRGKAADFARADELDARAKTAAAAMGMVMLLRRLSADPGARAPAVGPEPTVEARFKREGEYWTVAFEARTVRIKDAKGMGYLARLLAEPGREFHVLALAQPAASMGAGLSTSDDGLVSAADDAGPRLDATAKAAYLERLRDLEEDVAEADAWNDAERADRARSEISAITDELRAAVGLGGRDRREASIAERARLSVTRALRGAIARIGAQHPSLGHHLDATIRTGTYCSYRPDPRAPLSWIL